MYHNPNVLWANMHCATIRIVGPHVLWTNKYMLDHNACGPTIICGHNRCTCIVVHVGPHYMWTHHTYWPSNDVGQLYMLT